MAEMLRSISQRVLASHLFPSSRHVSARYCKSSYFDYSERVHANYGRKVPDSKIEIEFVRGLHNATIVVPRSEPDWEVEGLCRRKDFGAQHRYGLRLANGYSPDRVLDRVNDQEPIGPADGQATRLLQPGRVLPPSAPIWAERWSAAVASGRPQAEAFGWRTGRSSPPVAAHAREASRAQGPRQVLVDRQREPARVAICVNLNRLLHDPAPRLETHLGTRSGRRLRPLAYRFDRPLCLTPSRSQKWRMDRCH